MMNLSTLDPSTMIASVAGVIAIVGGAASLHYRASSAEMDKRLSVAEARISDFREAIDKNYEYCHKFAHDTNNLLMQHYARLRVIETALKIYTRD